MESNPLFLEEIVYRPPEESRSVLLEIAAGCSYAGCAFCHYSIEGAPILLLPEEEILQRIGLLAELYPDSKRMFFLGGNILAFRTAFLEQVFAWVRERMPLMAEFSLYGRADDILRKGPAALGALRAAGLDTVYVGLESGDDEVLRLINKGVTSAQTLEALELLESAGISYGLTSITGVGGQALSRQNALGTAALYAKLRPRSIRVFNLIVEEGTTIDKMIQSGDFIRCSDAELLNELLMMAEGLNLQADCRIVAEHIKKDQRFITTLPQGKDKLLSLIRGEIQAL